MLLRSKWRSSSRDSTSYGPVSWWLSYTTLAEQKGCEVKDLQTVSCLKIPVFTLLTVWSCRSRWAWPQCSTNTLARELPLLPLLSVWGQLVLREVLTGQKGLFCWIELESLYMSLVKIVIFQFCWLPLGNKQQRQALEGHQSQVWDKWRGGVNRMIYKIIYRTIVS